MQKTIKISCCVECSAHSLKSERIPYCGKMGRRIDDDFEHSVDPALIGFPEWCPLETIEPKGKVADYKKHVKTIMKIMSDGFNPDSLQDASHYMNCVVESAKKDTEAK